MKEIFGTQSIIRMDGESTLRALALSRELAGQNEYPCRRAF